MENDSRCHWEDMRFACKDVASKTFDDLVIRVGEATGAPLFSEALASIECRVAQEYPGGDHTLVLGEVVNVDYCDDHLANEPLLSYRSTFQSSSSQALQAKEPPTPTGTRPPLDPAQVRR